MGGGPSNSVDRPESRLSNEITRKPWATSSSTNPSGQSINCPPKAHHQQQRLALTALVVLDRDPVGLHNRHASDATGAIYATHCSRGQSADTGAGTVTTERMGLFKKRADPAELEAIKADIAAMAARLDRADADKDELGSRVHSLTSRLETPTPTPPPPPPPEPVASRR